MSSPDNLFHFTNKARLYKILESTFKLSFAREKISGTTITKEFAVPMVSFCDLRLSELKEHITKYGKFGIGLTKEWAIKKGLNPVMYVSGNSLFTNNYLKGIDNLYATWKSTNDPIVSNSISNSYINLLNSFRYMKNYEGMLSRNSKKSRKYRFADEREWRYVPELNNHINHPDFLSIHKIRTSREKASNNKKLNHLRLSFQPDDIKYLIVKSENEIDPLIKHLQHVKSIYSQTIVSRLSSRILTYEQINKDI